MRKALFTTFALLTAATGYSQTITPELLKQFAAQPLSTSERALQNAIQNGALRNMAKKNFNPASQDTYFSLDIQNQGITDQQSSGRCWMFTGLNVLRHHAAKKIGKRDIMFSQIYLFFYDQLEKSNLFLQSVIDTRKLSLDSQQVQWLMSNPLSDGGTYTGVADLVSKYGLVPQDIMPENYVSNHTDEFSTHLKRKLREIAINLRDRSDQGESEKQLIAYKDEQMKTVYRLLTLAYGTPVKEFEWAPRENGKYISTPRKYTPLEFYREYCSEAGNLQQDYVMLMNDPSRPYNKVYEIDMDRHTYDGHNWLYLNLSIEDLSRIAIASLQDSTQMYFSCDVGKYLDKNTGLLDADNFDYESLLGTTFGMDKRQRIQTHDSGSSHAMTLMAVDLDGEGKPLKWKVENSWGISYGHQGYLIMTRKWFEDYMFRVVVNKKYVPQDILRLTGQKPVRLPAWDPMFQMED